jgi:hypothetical protein
LSFKGEPMSRLLIQALRSHGRTDREDSFGSSTFSPGDCRL